MARRQLQPLAYETDCPICLCEPEDPIRTSCSHIYCTSCFGGMCQDAVKKSNIICEGDAGECGKVFPLKEISDALDFDTFEEVLAESFSSYVRRHPNQIRYCPTADCDRIYRVSSDPIKIPAIFTCFGCLGSICTACHVAHPKKTCNEHKGGAVSELEALRQIKDELGFKECSQCGTLIEKNGGCNHMVCEGCKGHICWRCKTLFDTSQACYAHMRELHGGIGL